MIIVKIEDKEFEMAEEWAEITFGQYLDIVNLNKDTGLNDVLKAVKVIAAVSNKPSECEEYLLKINKSEFETLADHFLWTNKSIEDFKSEKDSIVIDGKTYKIKKDYKKLSIGEMISVETLIANNKNLDPLEIAFGVLLRSVDDNGNEKEFNEDEFIYVVSSLKNKVKILDIYSCITFFLSGGQISTKENSSHFSIRKKETSS